MTGCVLPHVRRALPYQILHASLPLLVKARLDLESEADKAQQRNGASTAFSDDPTATSPALKSVLQNHVC